MAAAVEADAAGIVENVGARGDVEQATVRMPNSAGSAPVISDMLPIRFGSKMLPKPVTPSGSMTPLMRNCTLA